MMQNMQKEKTSFLKRWFPTFVHLFGQFSGEKSSGRESVSSDKPIEIKSLKPVNQLADNKVLGVLKEQPFFLQGLEDLETCGSFSREDCLQGLGWENHGLQEISTSRSDVIPAGVIRVISFDQPAQVEFVKLELSPPQKMDQPIEPEAESSDFFLRGLRSIGDIENMKNVELLALLRWEEQGQTLLEVDPDDYDLLDDLLEATEI
jgi:hypothetical protein